MTSSSTCKCLPQALKQKAAFCFRGLRCMSSSCTATRALVLQDLDGHNLLDCDTTTSLAEQFAKPPVGAEAVNRAVSISSSCSKR